MDNAELSERIGRIVRALEGIEYALATLVSRPTDVQSPPFAEPRVNPTWPWTAETVTQGFLASRWLRRDGNVYPGGALRGVPGPNSPIAGGEDAEAKVDVPSGIPRV